MVANDIDTLAEEEQEQKDLGGLSKKSCKHRHSLVIIQLGLQNCTLTRRSIIYIYVLKTMRAAYLSQKSESFDCKCVGDTGGKTVQKRLFTTGKGEKILTNRYINRSDGKKLCC